MARRKEGKRKHSTGHGKRRKRRIHATNTGDLLTNNFASQKALIHVTIFVT